MENVHQLPPAIERRQCPGCGYKIDQALVDMARFDFPCPRCGQNTLNEFTPEAPTPPSPEPAAPKRA